MPQKDFRNAGQTSSEKLQNRFTLYLMVSAQRTRSRHIQKCRQQESMFSSLESLLETGGEVPAWDEIFLSGNFCLSSWEQIMDTIEMPELHRALQKITPEDAGILFYHIILDLRYKEIEEITGVPVDEAEKRYSMVIRKLRKLIQRRG